MTNRVVIITGASSGIGAELARLYAKAGDLLGLIARRESALIALQQELMNDYGCDSRIGICDVSDQSAIFDVIATLIADFGRVDILIANAGISVPSPAYKANAAYLTDTIETNVLGAGYAAYAVIPTMIRQKAGHIAVISSLAGYRGLPEAGAYCASKAAVNALFESMRLDLKRFCISVSIIRPGFIQSAITDRNNFYMPFLQETRVGCQKIFKALERHQKIIAFPWPLAQLVRTLYFWPCWLYDRCFAGIRNTKRP
jgi:short-subunit dehydrogenase